MTPDAAETIALNALGWIVARDEVAAGLLAASGAEIGDVGARAGDPEFLGFVLDFLLSSEDLLVEFCEEAGSPPDAPTRARAALPGGDLPNWT